MSKKVRTIIIGASVLVVLIAAVVGLVIWKASIDAKNNASTQSDANANAISLINEDYTTITSADIKNATGEYTIVPNGDGGFKIDSLNGITQLEYLYTETLQDLSRLSATQVVEENCTDLTKYGLLKPTCSVKVKYSSGKEYTVYVGGTSADKGSKYMRLGDEKKVYAIASSSLANLEFTIDKYLNLQVTTPFDESDQSTIPNVNYMYVSRPDLTKPIILDTMSDEEIKLNTGMRSHVKLTSPIEALINETPAQTWVYGNFGIVAEGVKVSHPTAAQKKEYGFDSPAAVLKMKYNDKEQFTLTVGKGIKGTGDKANTIVSYYLMKDGVDQIYICKASDLVFLTIKPDTLMSSMIICPAVDSVDNVSVNFASGETYKIQFKEGKADKDGNVKNESSTVNGKTIDISNVREYYGLLLLTEAQGFNLEGNTYGGTLKATITYKYKTGSSETVQVYSNAKGTTTLALNGKVNYNGRSGYADKLLKEAKKLVQNQQVSTDW